MWHSVATTPRMGGFIIYFFLDFWSKNEYIIVWRLDMNNKELTSKIINKCIKRGQITFRTETYQDGCFWDYNLEQRKEVKELVWHKPSGFLWDVIFDRHPVIIFDVSQDVEYKDGDNTYKGEKI